MVNQFYKYQQNELTINLKSFNMKKKFPLFLLMIPQLTLFRTFLTKINKKQQKHRKSSHKNKPKPNKK